MELTECSTEQNGFFVVEPRGVFRTVEPVTVAALNKAGFVVSEKLCFGDRTLSLNGNSIAELFTSRDAADQFAALYAPNAKPVPGPIMLGWWYV